MQNNIKKSIFWFMLVSVLFLAWLMQNNFILNPDVSGLLLASKRLLVGDSYIYGFFEVSLPMVLYLYIPPLIIAKLLSAHILLVFLLYIFLLPIFICEEISFKIH